ncbi:MAG TPA: flagellar basal body L-ring protein FlgH [Steroidobacteraceae bacterium]|nr:flagellar basal body L-ring protein FlgH [Steroidobacteraceae bacterium]
MRNSSKRLCALACTALLAQLAGCESAPPPKDEALSWAQEPQPAASPGAIYQSGRQVALFENAVAHNVGDIVTIVLNESTQAQKSATTTTQKATNATLPGPTLLGKPVTINGVPILNNSIDNSTKFDGEGASKQSNSLSGFITVTVLRVLPNGNLFVKGEKWIAINQGQEYVRLTGIIRPIDLAPDNTVSSSKVGDARISYGGKGALNDTNTQSWLARFFNSPWAPF